MKYTTPEEKLEADRKRKREWARLNKDKVNNLTYAEKIARMTMKEYVAYLKRKNQNTRKWRASKKE